MPPVTPIVKYLLIINVVVFALVGLSGQVDPTLNLADILSLYYPESQLFLPLQIVSHFFMHGSLTHLLFNMMGLYFLGPIVEMRLGAQRFLLLYIAAALTAAGLHTAETWFTLSRIEQLAQAFNDAPTLDNLNALFASMEPSTLFGGQSFYGRQLGVLQNEIVLGNDIIPVVDQAWATALEHTRYIRELSRVVGASGALSGVAAAFAVFFPWQKLQIIFIPIGIYAAYLVPAFFVLDLVLGLANLSIDNIAHFAHIGGGIGGALLAFYWKKTTTPPWMRREDPGV